MAQVALYGRTSGPEQALQDTIETQRVILHRWAKEQGHEVTGWYPDADVCNEVPLDQRPEGGRLVRDAERGKFDAVVFTRIGRWARVGDIFRHARRLIEDNGVQLICLSDDISTEKPSDKLSLNVKLAVSEYERDNIRDQCLDGRYERAREGIYVGGIVPYGYLPVPADERGRRKKLAIDPEEAEVVRRIYRLLVVQRWGCSRISNLLNAEGIPSPSWSNADKRHRRHRPSESGKWHPATIRGIVRNTAYRGQQRFGHRNTHGREPALIGVPAIVDIETWEAANAQLSDNRQPALRADQRTYLLSGLSRPVLICVHCNDTACQGHTAHAERKNPHSYYVCGRKRNRVRDPIPGRMPCPLPYIPAKRLETDLWQNLSRYLMNAEETVRQLHEERAANGDQEHTLQEHADGLRAALGKKEEARRNAITLAAEKYITREDLAQQLERIRKEQNTLQDELAAALRGQSQARDLNRRAQDAIDWLIAWRGRIPADDDLDGKRQAVEALVYRIELSVEGNIVRAKYQFYADAGHVKNIMRPRCSLDVTTYSVPGGCWERRAA